MCYSLEVSLFSSALVYLILRSDNPSQHLLLGIGIHSDESYLWGKFSGEIPFILRLAFLVTIAYRYLFMKPFFNGFIQIMILTITWLCGYFSDSNASIWCFANVFYAYFFYFNTYFKVFQSITMILDPCLVGKINEDPPVKRTKYDSILMDRYTKSSVPQDLDAIVIGSGIG